nr:hypothetical protein [Tanacetum cinerariifolium]
LQNRAALQLQPPHQRPGLERLLGIGGGAARPRARRPHPDTAPGAAARPAALLLPKAACVARRPAARGAQARGWWRWPLPWPCAWCWILRWARCAYRRGRW